MADKLENMTFNSEEDLIKYLRENSQGIIESEGGVLIEDKKKFEAELRKKLVEFEHMINSQFSNSYTPYVDDDGVRHFYMRSYKKGLFSFLTKANMRIIEDKNFYSVEADIHGG